MQRYSKQLGSNLSGLEDRLKADRSKQASADQREHLALCELALLLVGLITSFMYNYTLQESQIARDFIMLLAAQAVIPQSQHSQQPCLSGLP